MPRVIDQQPKPKPKLKKRIKIKRVTNGKKHRTPIIRGIKNPPDKRSI